MGFFSRISESVKGFASTVRGVTGDLLEGTTKGNSIGSLVGVAVGFGVGIATGGILPAVMLGVGLGAACGIAGGAIAGAVNGAVRQHHAMADTATPPLSAEAQDIAASAAPQKATGLESPQMPAQPAVSFRERLSQEANSQTLSR